jgi:hypothetical protein
MKIMRKRSQLITVTKQQKTTPKTDVVDMSTGIIDIDNTPDVATWNKKIHLKNDTAQKD